MLAYAFKVLKQSNYDEVAAEKFDKIQDLFAAILSKGIAQQLKQGLHREYISRHDTLSVMRGKIDMPETIRKRIERKQKISCEYDELSENNLLNQILKTAMYYLIKDKSVANERKHSLNKLFVFFGEVSLIKPYDIQWNNMNYRRNNKTYEMLINICHLLLDGMLQTTNKGLYQLTSFSEENMASLYEKFILEYYREHHSDLTEVKAAKIKWDLVGENDEAMLRFLPDMQTDTTLRYGDKILIIDAKYYGKTLKKQYDKHSLHSNNLYQIYSYVKNQDKGATGNVSGLLIYAKTEEDIVPDCSYNIGGNRIGAKTLDLNMEFKYIAAQLDDIVESYLKKPVA